MEKHLLPRAFLITALICGATLAACASSPASQPAPTATSPDASSGRYRLPYADGTRVRIFDDTATHRPRGRIDFIAEAGQRPYRVVAAGAGRIVAIEDGHAIQQTGRAASECRNNYVWIAHPNGEWTLYSHMTQGSTTGDAGLVVGDEVEAGQFLGVEGAVGCAMLEHLHFEVARPAAPNPIDTGGFLRDATGARLREPQFCGAASRVNRGASYVAKSC